MNLVDAFVTKVISGPYEEYGKWWVDVEYISWGFRVKAGSCLAHGNRHRKCRKVFDF